MNPWVMKRLASERCPSCRQSKLACKATPRCYKAAGLRRKAQEGWLSWGQLSDMLKNYISDDERMWLQHSLEVYNDSDRVDPTDVEFQLSGVVSRNKLNIIMDALEAKRVLIEPYY